MTITALTAHDHDGKVLDISEMDDAALEAIHGVRNRRRNGLASFCRHCGLPVHLTRRRGLSFFTHDPGAGRKCDLAELARSSAGESPEHQAAKLVIVKNLRSTGHQAELERTFERRGDVVRVDVYSEHPDPQPHQVPSAWEVQLSSQARGEFSRRTQMIRTVANARAVWLTPYGDALADTLGFVTDGTAARVVDRMYADAELNEQLPPMDLADVVKGVNAKRARFFLVQSGLDGEWVILPTGVTAKRHRRPSLRLVETDEPVDRGFCDRASAGPCVVCGAICFLHPVHGERGHPCCIRHRDSGARGGCPACAESRAFRARLARRVESRF